MNHYRYIELCTAGPQITDEDRKRLATFVPRLTPIARAVRSAFARMQRERALAQAAAALPAGG